MTIEIITDYSPELQEAFDRLIPQLNPELPLLNQERIEEILSAETNTVLIATDENGTIAGMMTLVIYQIAAGSRAWIEDVVVDQNFRRQGIARKLSELAIKLADDKNATTLNLTSSPHREAANNLYQSLGFEERETNVYRYVFD